MATWGAEGFASAYSPSLRDRAGTWKQEVKQRPWRTTASWFVLLLTEDHLHRSSITHSELTPLPSRKCLIDLSAGKLDGDIFSIAVPSQMTLVWVKLTKAHQSSWVNGTCLLLSLTPPMFVCVQAGDDKRSSSAALHLASALFYF